jgi:hypothetical protein
MRNTALRKLSVHVVKASSSEQKLAPEGQYEGFLASPMIFQKEGRPLLGSVRRSHTVSGKHCGIREKRRPGAYSGDRAKSHFRRMHDRYG